MENAKWDGVAEEQIRLVLTKIVDEKPSDKKSQRLLEMIGG